MNANQSVIARPEADEYAPYYGRYISLVGEPDVLAALRKQTSETCALLKGLSEEKSEYRYAPEKWSVKEVLGHITDTERIMTYRALRFSRNDRTPIEGFEQDDYVRSGPFRHCKFQDLLEEFSLVRNATVAFFSCLDHDAWLRRGIANKMEISVRALAYVIAGHELHHRKILREQYLRLSD